MPRRKYFVWSDLLGHTPCCWLFGWIREQGMQLYVISYMKTKGFDTVFDEALGQAQEYTEHLYRSVDIRPCPAFALGTVTPAPCGLITEELLLAVRLVAITSGLVALELVDELSL